MATLRLPFVNGYRDRHGRQRFYLRRGGRNFCSLPGIPGTAVFQEAYEQALREFAPELCSSKRSRGPSASGTLGWVIEQYLASETFRQKKPSTKVVYLRIFDWLRSRFGTAELSSIEEKHVRKIRNLLKDRPSVADHTVDKIGMLWRFAKEHLELDDLGPNPAREVAAIHTTRKNHKAWPKELCEAFEALTNPRLVRAYYLLRYTGQRRSDIVKMRRDQFDGTAIEVVQEKTGTLCWIPCHTTLRRHLENSPADGEYLLSTKWGTPFRATSITNLVCKACSDLGYPGYSPHGLRHLAGAALAESGASVHEIMAILGHLTEREANDYVRQAQRKVMALTAIQKWEARDLKRAENGS